ncbi:hypothetical protein J6590_065825 [Homalodisca vitripennis]|nr:hypothetical protein J6590_065825 [Homalodisca vitripennis]
MEGRKFWKPYSFLADAFWPWNAQNVQRALAKNCIGRHAPDPCIAQLNDAARCTSAEFGCSPSSPAPPCRAVSPPPRTPSRHRAECIYSLKTFPIDIPLISYFARVRDFIKISALLGSFLAD